MSQSDLSDGSGGQRCRTHPSTVTLEYLDNVDSRAR
jgi:hypothetical protein